MKFSKLLITIILILGFISYPILAPAAKTVYGFYGLTGADPGLAGLDTTSIEDGSYAFGIDSSGYAYFYYLNKSSTATQSIPGIIAPITGTGRWILAPRIYSDAFYSNAAEYYHYLNVSNAATPLFTPTDGDFYVRRDTGISYIYNVADSGVAGGGHVPTLNSKIANIPSSPSSLPQTLFTRHLYGCTISNVNATGAITYTIPKADYGMQFTMYLAAAQRVNLDPNANDKICFTTCDSNGHYIYNTGVLGNWITMKTLADATGDYNWYVFSVYASGNWIFE